MPSGKGGEGDRGQEIFEGFFEEGTQAIVYILARSFLGKAPQRVFSSVVYQKGKCRAEREERVIGGKRFSREFLRKGRRQ